MSEISETFEHYCRVPVIVLGASGFIGRWVAHALSSYGANIFLAVRDSVTAAKIFSDFNIQGEICELDLREKESVMNLFAKVKPAITFNLAGYGVDSSERDEETAHYINANVIETVCKAVGQNSTRWIGQQVINAGSALEYGDISGDLSEDANPHPTTLYGMSKLKGTNLLAQCCREDDIKGMTVRLFTVYGPGEHNGRLLPTLIENAKNGQPVHLTAGTQKRDFTYVADVAEGLLRLGLAEKSRLGEIVNLATGQLTSVRTFVETAAGILRINQDKLRFNSEPTRSEEMCHSPVNNQRLQQLTGWKPPTSIEAGILKTHLFSASSSLSN